MTSKFQKFKSAINNPPPLRLAEIEFKSHFYQMLGVTTVCVILITKGFWYVIFAFIFSLGISYSQGVSSYQKYLAIKSLTTPEKMEEFEKDISFTRRRAKIVASVMGDKMGIFTAVVAVLVSVLIINPLQSRWTLWLAYLITIGLVYTFSYFFLFYWICYPIYKRRIKQEKEVNNGN